MQIRNSPDFFVARARALTHSVGSFTGAITPFSVSWSSSSFKRGLSVQPFRLGRKDWPRGTAVNRLDERSYVVDTPTGVLRRNRQHLK